jgi:sugar lactone lactonase YvrE
VTLFGAGFPIEDPLPVQVGAWTARAVFVSSGRVVIEVPLDVEGGSAPVSVGGAAPSHTVMVGRPWATGLHQVDNPVFDADGNLFATYSGGRGQDVAVSVFRVTPAGTREPFATGIANATSMTFGPDRALYVSSRFEGAVYRVAADGTRKQVASDLGVACGVAFDADGVMYVGDRSGTVFRVRNGEATPFVTLPPSVAAFHLAMSPEGELFVSAPTLGSYDHVYRIDRQGEVRTVPTALGRPQGLAFSPDGVLHVADALAGAGGLYRFADLEAAPELLVSGPTIVGVAFGPDGAVAVASSDTVYRFP